MLLGIDIGTTHTKVAAYDQDGTLLAANKALTPKFIYEVKEQGQEHYHPDKLWQSVTELIHQTVKESPKPIKALAVSSMGEAGVTLDDRGEVNYPIIPWYDHRAKR